MNATPSSPHTMNLSLQYLLWATVVYNDSLEKLQYAAVLFVLNSNSSKRKLKQTTETGKSQIIPPQKNDIYTVTFETLDGLTQHYLIL